VLWILAVGSFWTFAYRMYHTWSEINRLDAAAREPSAGGGEASPAAGEASQPGAERRNPPGVARRAPAPR
jgi:hypothetical protein